MALEMTMRDVLGNMEKMVSGYGFHEMGGDFEIIAIESATQPSPLARDADIAHCREIFSADISSLPLLSRQVA